MPPWTLYAAASWPDWFKRLLSIAITAFPFGVVLYFLLRNLKPSDVAKTFDDLTMEMHYSAVQWHYNAVRKRGDAHSDPTWDTAWDATNTPAILSSLQVEHGAIAHPGAVAHTPTPLTQRPADPQTSPKQQPLQPQQPPLQPPQPQRQQPPRDTEPYRYADLAAAMDVGEIEGHAHRRSHEVLDCDEDGRDKATGIVQERETAPHAAVPRAATPEAALEAAPEAAPEAARRLLIHAAPSAAAHAAASQAAAAAQHAAAFDCAPLSAPVSCASSRDYAAAFSSRDRNPASARSSARPSARPSTCDSAQPSAFDSFRGPSARDESCRGMSARNGSSARISTPLSKATGVVDLSLPDLSSLPASRYASRYASRPPPATTAAPIVATHVAAATPIATPIVATPIDDRTRAASQAGPVAGLACGAAPDAASIRASFRVRSMTNLQSPRIAETAEQQKHQEQKQEAKQQEERQMRQQMRQQMAAAAYPPPKLLSPPLEPPRLTQLQAPQAGGTEWSARSSRCAATSESTGSGTSSSTRSEQSPGSAMALPPQLPSLQLVTPQHVASAVAARSYRKGTGSTQEFLFI